MRIEQLTIPHNGRVSEAYVYVPDGDGKFPFVIISHGYNGYGGDHDSHARMLAEAGIGAVTHTFCGGSTRDKSGFQTVDMTLFTECEDLEAIIAAVKKLPYVDKLALHGESQGGLITAMTAEAHPGDFFAVSLLYPAFCIPDNWRETFPNESEIPEYVDFWGMRLGRGFFVTLRGIDTEKIGSQYGGPVLIMQGTEDPVVKEAHSARAARRYSNARYEIFPGEGHGFSPEGWRRMTEMTVDFLRANA